MPFGNLAKIAATTAEPLQFGKHLETLFKVYHPYKERFRVSLLGADEYLLYYILENNQQIKELIGNRFTRVGHMLTLCKLQLKTYTQNIIKC